MIERSSGRRVAVVASVLASLVTGPGWLAQPAEARQPTAASASRVLVMPFEAPDQDARSVWLGEGSAVILTDGLLALGMPALRRSERLRSLELLRVPAMPGLSYASIIRVGQVLGASQVVVGTYQLVSDELTVRARAIFLDAGSMTPEIVERGPLPEIFAIYDRIARRLVPGATVSNTTLAASHPPLVAFEQYIKGLLAEAPQRKLAFLNEALRLDPTLARASLALWDVHTDAGDDRAALAAVRATPATHPLARQSRFLAAISLLRLGRYQESFDLLTQLNAEASDATLLNDLGVVQLRRPAGSPGGSAVAYFGAAAKLDAVDSFFNLGYAYWIDGQAEAAVQWLREAVRRDPADHAAHYVLGAALEATGRTTESARERQLARNLSSTYEDWERRRPVTQLVPPALERIRMDLGLPSALRVENVIEAAGQRDQEQLAAFYLQAGRMAFEKERDAEAIDELRRAIYLSPYDHDAHLLLGRAYLRSGRLSDAITSLKISIWSADTIAARLALAEAYVVSGALAEARVEIRVVLEQEPSNVQARALLERLGPEP